MPTAAAPAPAAVSPEFSLSALLLVLGGIALVGQTVVGGLPDKILALAGNKKASPAPTGAGGLGGTGVAGAGGAGAATATPAHTGVPGAVLGPGALSGKFGGGVQVGGKNPYIGEF